MSRFLDDLALAAPEEYVPATVQSLLAWLQIKEAPRSQQESAIREWLRTHEPGQLLQSTLRRKGFGHLLDGRESA